MATNKYIIQLVVETGTGQAKVQGVSKAFQDLEKSATRVKPALDKAKKATDGMGGAAGIAGATAAELGRTISDMPYGIQAVTNNISQLGSMFALLVSSSGGVMKALGNLKTIMLGPAGILIAFQAVVAAVDFFAQAQRKAKKDVEGTTEAINVQAKAIDGLISSFDISEIVKQFDYLTGEEGIGGAFTDLEKRVSDVVDLLMDRSPEFRAAFESLTPEEQKDVDMLKKLITEYSNILEIKDRIRRFNKQLQDEDITKDEADRIEQNIIDAEIALTLRLQEFKTKMSDDLNTSIDTFYDFGKDAVFEVERGVEDALAERFEGFSEKFRGIMKITEAEEPEPYFPYVNLKKLETEMEIEEELNKQEELKKIRERAERDRLRSEMAMINAIADIKFAEADIAQTIFNTIGELSEESRFLQAVALVGESAAGIAKIIINTKAANAALTLQAAAFLPLKPALEAQKVANNISAAAGIAANVASTAVAIRALKAPVQTPSGGSIGSDASGSVPASALPAFNVVGSSTSQFAQILAAQGQQPVKAYVVAGEVSTAQSLERNRVKEASI